MLLGTFLLAAARSAVGELNEGQLDYRDAIVYHERFYWRKITTASCPIVCPLTSGQRDASFRLIDATRCESCLSQRPVADLQML